MNRKIFLFWMLVLIGALFVSSTSVPLHADTLTVSSSPVTGIYITVTRLSNGSTVVSNYTNFDWTYALEPEIRLEAPASHGGRLFLYWIQNGTVYTNRTIEFKMDRDRDACAYYDYAKLTVQSSPDSGAFITVSPSDRNGNGSGTTGFTRTYNEGTAVTLTAPPTHNGKIFSKWIIDGADNASRTITVTMSMNRSVQAVYVIPTYTLDIQSSPDVGAVITVTPDDNSCNGNGVTNFNRTYNEGTAVTLTAPTTHNGKIFSKWIIDGSENVNRIIMITMNNNHTAAAVYGESATYMLTVQSSPDMGAIITVTPDDNSGNGSGITNFTRTYNAGTAVTLTAPTTHNGKIFSKWIIDGSDNANNTITVTMNTSHSAEAVYGESATYMLTVQSSPDAAVNITVTPNDNSGNGNGVTNFTRTYNRGTTVTLTAPTTHNGKAFSKWIIDGADNANRTIMLTMNNNHTAAAVYGEPAIYMLTVQSSPDMGAIITVTPVDNSGNGSGITNFTRIYNGGTSVTLTAPTTHNGKIFSKWIIDGSDNANETVMVTMNNNHTAAAVYVKPAATYILTVQSSPDAAANITVTPNDNSGNGNGITNFTRTYNKGTVVTLTAPPSHNDREFLKWEIDGAENTDPTIHFTMDRSHTAAAVYAGSATCILTVQSSPDVGADITVTPDDNNGSGNGTTNFTRTYYDGTTVTITAPSIYNGKEFSKWTVEGVDAANYTSLSVQITMNGNLTATAYYAAPAPQYISLNRSKQNFGYILEGSVTNPQLAEITCSSGALTWTTTTDVSWLNVDPSSGTGSGEIAVSINTSASGLAAGNYTGRVIVSAVKAVNSPKTITVLLKVYEPGTHADPFGEFATPANGSTVYSSIPVTGWVLDDIGIESVRIYREEESALAYIGDAIFIEGARPDVEQAYPDYPMNFQAGWGYMMITNFFPNGGNGTFNIHAIASTMEGQEVTLGIKTINCDNSNATKPFGAIDTPNQGGIASGSNFINWGWVLTPQPNSIPIDGSTINVFVDGVNLGNPFYNIYRSDIAELFPDYSNSNGAGGYFYLDTTKYSNGIHTISWTVTDNAGNSDGIGSRYFSVLNLENPSAASTAALGNQDNLSIQNLPVSRAPVYLDKGYKTSIERRDHRQTLYSDNEEPINIVIKPGERIEIGLNDNNENAWNTNRWAGFHLIGDETKPLPIGSFLDVINGIFYWQPGPGFIGQYRLVFIEKGQNGELAKKMISVVIEAKF